MSEEIRFIVNELNKEPFKKNFTFISFDSLKPEGLLQVLIDVLADIDPSNRVDIREEEPELTIARILNSLRILKYPIRDEDDPTYLRTGLMTVSPNVIYPILSWLLPKIEELKTRAYLAKFLVKVDVPQDQRADIEVEELYQQYEEKIEVFKQSHKQLDNLKNKGFTTAELRKDIQAMEQEQESVTRKIERLKRQVEGTANLEGLMEVVRTFRKEREKMKELTEQGLSQSQALNQAEQRISRLQRQFKEIQNSNSSSTPEGIMQRLEQDVDVAKYIVNTKLPKEIEGRQKQVRIFENVTSDNSMTGRDLEEISNKIERVRADVNEMLMRKMMKTEDDKLLMFRQQAAIVSNKKEAIIEKLNEVRGEYLQCKEEIREKSQILQNIRSSAELSVKEDDFKDYVKNLRVKSTRYKQMKAELNYFKTESGILAKTIFILEEQLKNTSIDLAAIEARLGIKGFTEIQENLEKISSQKSHIDEEKSKNLEQMAMTVQELHEKINVKKIDLAPLVKNLNSMRQSVQMVGHEHDALKRKYDGVSATVESSLRNLTKDFDEIKNKFEEDERRYCRYKSEIVIFKVDSKRMQDELKSYTSGSGAGKTRPFKDQLLSKIAEQERLTKSLKEEEKRILENQSNRVNQAVMWKDLCKLFELKIKLRESGNDGIQNSVF